MISLITVTIILNLLQLSQGHKIQILKSMTEIIKYDNGVIQIDVAVQVIKHVSVEMTAKKVSQC